MLAQTIDAFIGRQIEGLCAEVTYEPATVTGEMLRPCGQFATAAVAPPIEKTDGA